MTAQGPRCSVPAEISRRHNWYQAATSSTGRAPAWLWRCRDPETWQPTGSRITIVNPVERGRDYSPVYFGVSRTGLLVYAPTGRRRPPRLGSRQGVETRSARNAATSKCNLAMARKLSVDDDGARRLHVWLYKRRARAPHSHAPCLAWAPQAQPGSGLAVPARFVAYTHHARCTSDDARSCRVAPEASARGADSYPRRGRRTDDIFCSRRRA